MKERELAERPKKKPRWSGARVGPSIRLDEEEPMNI
jgi:hypothetical protein